MPGSAREPSDTLNREVLASEGVQTTAGQWLVEQGLDWGRDYGAFEPQSLIDTVAAIEAEAVAAERARLRALVEGLPLMEGRAHKIKSGENKGMYEVDLFLPLLHVLAALEGPDAR